MYVAFKVLHDFPAIATSAAKRFDEVIVDEAQDTDQLQFNCLDLLKKAGLGSLVMVGDPDQSIYDWTGTASLESFDSFASGRGLAGLHLTGNFRSSQRICDLAHAFSTRTSPDKAVGPDGAASNDPELLLYDTGNLAALLSHFEARAVACGVRPEAAVLIGRSDSAVRLINGSRIVEAMPLVEILLDCKDRFTRDSRLDPRTIHRLEGLLANLAWGSPVISELPASDRRALRQKAFLLLVNLPSLTGDLFAWISQARTITETVVDDLSQSSGTKLGNRIRSRKKATDELIDLAKVFSKTTTTTPMARTVHSVKGESHEATLLIASKPGKYNQPREWIGHRLGGERTAETNIAYVAMTRARKYLAVAVPKTTPAEVVTGYEQAGFRKTTI